MYQTYTCQYSGHEDEQIIGLCLDQNCDSKAQYCNQCLYSRHSTHQKNCKSMTKVKQMIQSYQQDIFDWLNYIEKEFQTIQKQYQTTVKILNNEKIKITAIEKHLQNEEYQQITEKISFMKQIQIIQEAKQDVKSKNFTDALISINNLLQSPKVEQKQIRQKQISIIEVTQEQYNQESLLKFSQKESEKDNIKNSIALGKKHNLLGKYDEAIKCYDKVLQIDFFNAEAHREKGVALLNQSKNQTAIESLDYAIMVDDKNAISYYLKGQVLFNQDSFQEAINQYNQAICLDINYTEAYNMKGRALQELNKHKEAIQEFDLAIQTDPAYMPAYNNKGDCESQYILGVSLKILIHYEEALQCFQQVLEFDPKNEIAQKHIDEMKARNIVFNVLNQFYRKAINQ